MIKVSAVLLASLIGSAVQAQDTCGDVLRGLYDFRNTSIDLNTIRSFKNWQCSHSRSNSSSSHTLNVPGYFDGTSNSAQNELNEICSEQNEYAALQLAQSSNFRTVNENVVAAWKECMDQPGLKSGLIFGSDPNRFYVVLSYRRVNNQTTRAVLDPGTQGFRVTGPATCSDPWDGQARTVISGQRIFECTRIDASKEVSVTIAADHPIDGAGELLIVPKYTPPPQASPGEKVIEALAHGQTCTIQYNSGGWGTINGKSAYQIQWDNVESGWRVQGRKGASNTNQTATYPPKKVSQGSGSYFFNHWGITFEIKHDATIDSIPFEDSRNGNIVPSGRIHGRIFC